MLWLDKITHVTKYMNKLIIAFLTFAPAFAFAQSLSRVETLLNSIGRLVDAALPIVVGLALLAFLWGLVKYIFAQGNEESKSEAKKVMLWGIIALFVMVAVWGLVQFIATSLDVQTGGELPVPGVQNL